MCGFFGIVDLSGNISDKDKFEISKGANFIKYRGPDDQGKYEDKHLFLIFNRLSILDLNSKSPPLVCENDRIIVVCNGEIYNFKELREELSRKYSFQTNQDTEVILHGYIEWGDEIWKKLNGMFSIALWNKRNKKLTLVRDHVGIKPLHYMLKNNKIYFSNDYNAFFCQTYLEPKLNRDSILSYLSFRYVIGNRTFLKDVYDVLPGEKIDFNGNLNSQIYWDLNLNKKDNHDEKYYLENLRDKINNSVKSHLISDVPIGAFISGGLDSSLIVYYMKKFQKKIMTFATGIDEDLYNEFNYVDMLASDLNLENNKTLINEDIFLNEMTNVINYRGEPCAIPHETGFFLMSKKMKNNIKVVLSGEGADELFGGYGRLFKSPIDYYKKKIISPNLTTMSHFLDRYSIFKKSDKLDLLNLETFENKLFDDYSLNYLNEIFDKVSHFNYFDKLYYVMIKIHLVNMLNRLDRMTMASSIEARVPFLDKKLVEFIFSIPSKYKIKWKNRSSKIKGWLSNSEHLSENYDSPKYLLKLLAQDKINKDIIDRKKKAFPLPMNNWLSKKLGNFCRDILLDKNCKIDSFVNKKNIEKILNQNEYHSREDLDGKRIWMLTNLELWLREKFS